MEVEKRVEDTVFFEELENNERNISGVSDSILANKDLRFLLNNTPYSHEALEEADVSAKRVMPSAYTSNTALDAILAKGDSVFIVLPAKSGNLRKINAAEFLKNGRWIDPNVGHTNVKDLNLEKFEVTLPTSGRKINIRVVDNPLSVLMTNGTPNSGWYLCAGIFCTGEESQFYNFPFPNHAKMIQHMKPFFLNLDGALPPALVKRTNTHILNVSRHQRHLDAASQKQFLQQLENFLMQPRAQGCLSLTLKIKP